MFKSRASMSISQWLIKCLKHMGSGSILTLKFHDSRFNINRTILQWFRICPLKTYGCLINLFSGKQWLKCLWGPESYWWWVGILGTNLKFINLWRLQEMVSRTLGMGRWPSRAMADPSERIAGKGPISRNSCRGLFWVWWCKWVEWIVMGIWLQANGRPLWL